MPSPLNGFTVPAASPTTSHVGPRLGPDRAAHRQPPAGRLAAALVRAQLPVGRRGGHVLVEQVGGVDALEVAERGQQARRRRSPCRRRPGRSSRSRAAGCRRGPSRRGPTRSTARRAAGSPSSPGWRCRRATPGCGRCRGPGRSGCWRRRPPPRSGPGRPPGAALSPPADHGAPHEAPVDDRGDRLGALPQRGAGLDRVLGHELVEVAAAHDVAVRRELGVGRPGQLEGPAVGGGPQPLEAVEVLEPVGQAHVGELAHRPGRQAVAAGLLAREGLALDDRDLVAGLGQPVAGGGAGRAAADDEDVDVGTTLGGARQRASRSA